MERSATSQEKSRICVPHSPEKRCKQLVYFTGQTVDRLKHGLLSNSLCRATQTSGQFSSGKAVRIASRNSRIIYICCRSCKAAIILSTADAVERSRNGGDSTFALYNAPARSPFLSITSPAKNAGCKLSKILSSS